MRPCYPGADVLLYVQRHGVAEDSSPLGDSERELTDEGRLKLQLILSAAKRAGAKPDLILCSPYVRAEQTAELAAQALEVTEEPEAEGFLLPFSDVLATWEEIRALREFSSVLLVGHNPHLSELVSALLSSPGAVAMKKGAIACLEINPASPSPSGSLVWLLTAKLAGG